MEKQRQQKWKWEGEGKGRRKSKMEDAGFNPLLITIPSSAYCRQALTPLPGDGRRTHSAPESVLTRISDCLNDTIDLSVCLSVSQPLSLFLSLSPFRPLYSSFFFFSFFLLFFLSFLSSFTFLVTDVEIKVPWENLHQGDWRHMETTLRLTGICGLQMSKDYNGIVIIIREWESGEGRRTDRQKEAKRER